MTTPFEALLEVEGRETFAPFVGDDRLSGAMLYSELRLNRVKVGFGWK